MQCYNDDERWTIRRSYNWKRKDENDLKEEMRNQPSTVQRHRDTNGYRVVEVAERYSKGRF